MDEIALLKKGIITKDTPKHTYRRVSAELANEPPPIQTVYEDKWVCSAVGAVGACRK